MLYVLSPESANIMYPEYTVRTEHKTLHITIPIFHGLSDGPDGPLFFLPIGFIMIIKFNKNYDVENI